MADIPIDCECGCQVTFIEGDQDRNYFTRCCAKHKDIARFAVASPSDTIIKLAKLKLARKLRGE